MRWPFLLAIPVTVLAGCGIAPASPFRVDSDARSGPTLAPLRAGAAARDLAVPRGVPLGGYGGGDRREELPFMVGLGVWGRLALEAHQGWHEKRPDGLADMLTPSQGVLDPVRAKALVLMAGENTTPFALVSLDLIEADPDLHARIVELVADLGFTRASLTICATHTHSGPAAFMRMPLARLIAMDNYRPEVAEAIARSAAEAVRAAHGQLSPARLACVTAWDRNADGVPQVARNRRASRFPGVIADTDVDPEIIVLALSAAETGRRLATVVNYAVHPTVHGPSNLQLSADVAGAIERALSARLGGSPVLFINGAEGDVGPRGSGAGSERCQQLGTALADVVVPALQQVDALLEPGEATAVRISSVLGRRGFGSGYIAAVAGSRERFLDAWRSPWRFVMAPLTLPINLLLWLPLGLDNVTVSLSPTLDLGLVVDLSPYGADVEFLIGAWRVETAQGDDLALLLIPAEATHDVGLAMKASARERGASKVLICGLANDAMSYVASRDRYMLGGYEALMTMYGPETAQHLQEAVDEALARLYR